MGNGEYEKRKTKMAYIAETREEFDKYCFRQLPRPVGRGGFVDFGFFYLLDSVGNFVGGRQSKRNYEKTEKKGPKWQK